MSATGYVYVWEAQKLAQLEELFRATFDDKNTAQAFSGEIMRYTYESGMPNFAGSQIGVAFDAQAELRWEQNQPKLFKVLVLTEDAKRLPGDPKLECDVVSGRTSDAKLIGYDKKDKRLPVPPEEKEAKYLYYKDRATGQIRFMRLVLSGK